MANPSLDAIEGLADALGIDPAAFFEIVALVAPYEAAEEVPFAFDGSCFHRGLASPRDGSYRVGDKYSELRFSSFEEALKYLRTMKTARWRRPNDAGNWSRVSAVRWGKAENPKSTSR